MEGVEFAAQVALAVASWSAVGIAALLLRKVQKLLRELAMMREGSKATLRMALTDAYREFVVEGKRMSIERKREVEEMADAYTGLGGNGTVKRQVAELMDVRPWIVMDD